MISRINSKNRVENHGEVFTGQREVNAMINMVQEQVERLDSRFLEPACGDGNFLVEVLERKLSNISQKDGAKEWEYNALIALGSLYGIDILLDNVENCRQRLTNIFFRRYPQKLLKELSDSHRKNLEKSITYILKYNIVHGDALTYTQVGMEEPILFSEWTQVPHFLIQRKEFSFRNLIAKNDSRTLGIFSDIGEEAFLPKEKNIWQPIRYNEIHNALKLVR